VAGVSPRCYAGCVTSAARTKALSLEADDAALVAAMAQGDTGALAKIYDLHAPVMMALAQRILGSRSEAEDLVHDVFLEAWRHAADYDQSRGSVRAWLVLRTRSRAIDVRKSAAVSRTVTVGDTTWLERLLGGGEDASLGPDRELVRQLLKSLPEEQRTVLLLGYFEGLSSSEIAARISTPVGTVKSRVAAALTRLRAALAARRKDEP
jgi:RNA polymerase sigma-70 factor, ECF subfamily